jgi:hypothetical protein
MPNMLNRRGRAVPAFVYASRGTRKTMRTWAGLNTISRDR